MKILKVAATLQLLIIAFVFAVGQFTPAEAEYIPSPPTLNDLYRIDSEYMKMSEFPKKLVLYDVLMVDVDLSTLGDEDNVTANLYLPYVPENLDDIILFDGYHVAYFSFERINEGCVKIMAKAKDIKAFDGNVGLYLFVTGYED